MGPSAKCVLHCYATERTIPQIRNILRADTTLYTQEKNFQHFVYVNYKIHEFIYLLDVTNSGFDQVLDNKQLV